MSESREPTLPSGMSDLVEIIEQRDSARASERLASVVFRTTCRRIATRLLPQLAQTIDHDLLFTDQPELVMPLLRETAGEAIQPIVNEETKEEMVNMLADEIWHLLVSERMQRKGST